MPEIFRDGSLCVVCGSPGDKKCGGCKSVTYCGSKCQKLDWPRHKRLCAPVVIKEWEGRGRGLVASKNIKMGDLIVKDKAVITIKGDADTWEAGAEIQRQVDNLAKDDKVEFFKLTKMKKLLDICDAFVAAAGDNSDNIKKANLAEKYKHVTAVFYNNDISAADESKNLFLTLALLNHSCAPNSSWSRADDNLKVLELRAIKDIQEGDEVTVNYISVEGRYSDREARQQRLSDGWGFRCDCRLCVSGEEEDVKLRINAIQSEMRNICDTSLDRINWTGLAEYQDQVLDLVTTLSCAPLLLPRECQSLANLAQLARKEVLVEKAQHLWKEVLERRKVSQALKQYGKVEQLFKDWKPNLMKALTPNEKEIENFLWLM